MFGEILSIAGPILGSMMQSDSAEDAQRAQSESSAAAIAEQRRQYDQSRADLAPWRNVGGAAANRLGTLLGLGGYESGDQPSQLAMPTREQFMRPGGPTQVWQMMSGEFEGGWGSELRPRLQTIESGPVFDDAAYNQAMADYESRMAAARNASPDPEFGALNRKFTLADLWDDPVTQASFQFGLDEGTKALDRMSGARGMRNSGQAVKALTRFGTDYTGQKAGESYNRFYGDQDRTYNRLAGVAGTGQTAAQNTASMGQNSANNISSLISAQGNARGAAAIAGGNAWANAANSASNAWGQQSMLDKILNRGGAAGRGYDGSGWQEGFVW